MGIIRLRYLIISVLLSSIGVYLLFLEKNSKIENYLETQNIKIEQYYQIIYGNQKNIATIIFNNFINKQEIKVLLRDKKREQLHKKLEKTYTLLHQNNLKQLHFHLPNNDSFLRFHRPLKFGDNLSDVRDTVAYVNRTKKPIDGFEEGRIYNGFRFVFPLTLDGVHLGSVEVSFSTLAMSKEFVEKLNIIGNFLINKELIKEKVFKNELQNYEQSPLKEFFVERETVNFIHQNTNRKKGACFTDDVKQRYYNLIGKNEIFSLYSKSINRVLTFKKIHNPVTNKFIALFVVRDKGDYISNKTKNFYFISTILVVLIFSVCWFICRINIYKEKITIINKGLEKRIKEEVEKNSLKDKQLFHQAKMAQMGELISMIAHQWRQPLGAIGSSVVGLQNKLSLGKYNLSLENEREEFIKILDKKLNNISEYTEFLSKTIDNFRNFYKKDNSKESVKLDVVIKDTLNIIQTSMKNHGVEFTIELEELEPITIYKNEFIQVILNILKNSEDNFIEKSLEKKAITIKTYTQEKFQIISIQDNGGGIEKEILQKIFDPYFSTKNDKNGTGLGLYMSKIIIEEHHNGKLEVSNTKDGVEFTIKIQGEKG